MSTRGRLTLNISLLATTFNTQRLASGRNRKPQTSRNNKPVTHSEVLSMIRANNKLMIEDKVTYTTQNGGIDYNGSVLSMTAGLIRGDAAVDQFTGNLLRPSSLNILGTVSTNQTFNTVRLLLFQWQDASAPVPAGVMQFIGSANAPFAPILWSNHHKVHVLHDQLISIAPVAGSYAIKNFRIHVSGGFKTIQVQTGGTLIQNYGIYLLLISDDGAPVYPQVLFDSELRFTDA